MYRAPLSYRARAESLVGTREAGAALASVRALQTSQVWEKSLPKLRRKINEMTNRFTRAISVVH